MQNLQRRNMTPQENSCRNTNEKLTEKKSPKLLNYQCLQKKKLDTLCKTMDFSYCMLAVFPKKGNLIHFFSFKIK